MDMITRMILAAVFCLLAAGALAQQGADPVVPQPPATDFSKVEIKTIDLGNRTYMLEGQGGNITIALAANGVFMVDSQFEPLHGKIKAAVAQLTRQPVRFLINTHYHRDHTGGNAAFAADGVGIIAHQNASNRLAAGAVNGLTGNKTPPASEKALPSKTYGKATTLNLRGRKVQLRHIPRAHTDGDTFVWFADANVIATGDIVTVGSRYPNIDFANGGSINGMIAGVDVFIKLANEETKIVPGHGPVLRKQDLVEYRAMLATARDRMAKLVAEGRSEADVLAARPFADFDEKIGVNEQGSRNFIRVVYNSLKRK
jgi:glyoxylase-like metal-dependent hydrolase (beta-lactamase superfamily II)